MSDIVTGSTALAIENAALRAEVERLRAALLYALPIVEKYGWTQGNNPAFHAELTVPIRAALAQEKQDE